tara:strand:- start:203 stop:424 length:222 start_codon:yes stop_codon:yes gene_type:complete
MWFNVIKNKNVMDIYTTFKERNSHLWTEAGQLPGQGEVSTLDSIVIRTINENINKPNVMELVKIAAENYILKD